MGDEESIDCATLSQCKKAIPVGDFALSFDEPKEGIFATAVDSEFSSDTPRCFVYLEVWEDTISSIEDSDLITTDIEGSDSSLHYSVAFRSLPAGGKIRKSDDLTDFLNAQRKRHRGRLFVPIALLEMTKKGSTKISHYASESADALKPHSTISVKRVTSKMDKSYHVAEVHHKIGESAGSEYSERIQCEYCGTENDSTSKFCENCGSRIAS